MNLDLHLAAIARPDSSARRTMSVWPNVFRRLRPDPLPLSTADPQSAQQGSKNQASGPSPSASCRGPEIWPAVLVPVRVLFAVLKSGQVVKRMGHQIKKIHLILFIRDGLNF